MAGTGPAPKTTRRRTNAPARGEFIPTPGIGWQHGLVPDPPDGLLVTSRNAWAAWMGAWFASHWAAEDIHVLRQVVKLFDKIERNDASSAEMTQYRQLLDSYGITPKGQQDRRWTKPKGDEAPAVVPGDEPAIDPRFAHLRAV